MKFAKPFRLRLNKFPRLATALGKAGRVSSDSISSHCSNNFSQEKPGRKLGISQVKGEERIARASGAEPTLGSRKKAIPRKRTRETVRTYENGIKVLGPNYERCMTDEAKRKRREEVYELAGGLCQKKINGMIHGIEVGLSEGHLHHKRKRSLGRNDHPSNLEWDCPECHIRYHTEGEGK
jgi:hypothetical protein